MGRWLDDLADVARRSGFPVIEVDGWPRRCRNGSGGNSTGGYQSGAPNHLMIHHTATGPASDGWPDVNYCCSGSGDSPLGNLYLSRNGTIYVMAGGAANTNGTGQDPCGIVSPDNMNSQSIAIEAGNGGTGEVWPDAQQNSYVALCEALLEAYGIHVGALHAHWEYSPGRKIDPAGNSRFAGGGSSWNMDTYRGEVWLNLGSDPPPAWTGPPREEWKVIPEYDPPVPVADACSARDGGAWLVTPEGAIYTVAPAPYLGGPYGKPYFAGRRAATIAEHADGYVVTATSGETYHYPGS